MVPLPFLPRSAVLAMIARDEREREQAVAEDRARLRDEFAMAALPEAWAAELADLQHFNDGVTERHVSEVQVANRAYRMADAMLVARTKG